MVGSRVVKLFVAIFVSGNERFKPTSHTRVRSTKLSCKASGHSKLRHELKQLWWIHSILEPLLNPLACIDLWHRNQASRRATRVYKVVIVQSLTCSFFPRDREYSSHRWPKRRTRRWSTCSRCRASKVGDHRLANPGTGIKRSRWIQRKSARRKSS